MRSGPLALSAIAALVAALVTCADAAVLITVDKSSQQMRVEVDGELKWTWPVSTGRSGFDTPSGRYTTFRMEADHFSKEWDDAPMPHSIFFTQKGHAIHGYLNTRQIGTPASHGCVRLAPGNATALYALVKAEGMSNTKVIITGDTRLAQAPRSAPQRREAGDGARSNRPPPNYAAPTELPRGYAPGYRYAPAPSAYQPAYRPYNLYRASPYGY